MLKKIIVLLLLLITLPAQAHDPDKVTQNITLLLDKNRVTVIYDASYGDTLAHLEFLKTDVDRDGRISPEEEDAFLERQAHALTGPLVFRIDKKNIGLTVLKKASTQLPDGHWNIRIVLRSPPLDIKQGEHRITWADNHFSADVIQSTRFAVHAGKGFRTIDVQQDRQNLIWRIQAGPALKGDSSGLTKQGTTALPTETDSPGETQRLKNLLATDSLNFWFILGALAIAAFMGALHALSPGHGKTMVAAYLVGEKGTIRHAVILGLTVTFTHVGSVLLLGTIALALSEFILPQQLYPWLSLASGLIILLVGFRMLDNAVHSTHDHSHHHDHAHPHDHTHSHAHGDGAHHHHHHTHPHEHQITLSNLLMLGISGGMVPCPSALVILLAAVAMHRIVFGLALIVAFSVGLAAVLVTLGILVVKSSHLLLSQQTSFRGKIRYLPVISAVVIILIGIVMILNFLQVKIF